MTKVDNKKVISRLAMRQLRSDRKLSAVVLISIVLTCILFTVITTIGGSLLNGVQAETMRQVGGSSMAGVKCVLPEDYEKLKADRAVRSIYYRIIVGNGANSEFKDLSAEIVCAGSEGSAKETFCMPTEGRLPEGLDEIAVSSLVLDKLGLPRELGTAVPIIVDIDGEQFEHTFELCGWWQGDKVSMAQECWVSRAFADKYAPTPGIKFTEQLETMNYAGYWQVDFNFSNSWNIEKKTEQLMERVYGSTDEAPGYGVNWAYTTSKTDPGTVAGGILALLVVFAAGYLIIYNIFHINISANIRSYGLLKTIGTTSKQIRRIVRVQAAVYSVLGIPAGLIIGLLLGRVLFGSVLTTLNIYSMESYSISPGLTAVICLISAVFTFVTVMISCRKPCRIAGSVSPIEALRYNETDIHTKKKSKKTGRITPLSVARNNMSRSRKKTVIVVLSLTLSLVLVNTLFTVLKGIDMDKFVRTQIVGDFIITQIQNSEFDEDAFFKITPEQIGYLDSVDGTEQVSPIYFQWGELEFHTEPLERLNTLCDKYTDTDKYGEITNAKQSGSIPTDIYGITDDVLNVLEPSEDEFDLIKWQSGKYAIVNTYYLGAEDEKGEPLYSVGDTLTLTAWDGEDERTKDFEVMALCEMPYALSKQSYYMFGGQVIIPEGEYFELTDNRSAMTVMINAEDNRFDEVDAQIRNMTDSGDSQLMVKSKQTYLEQYNDFIRMIKLVGGMLSCILALIGILNFINAVVTGIISRKRELAMMNAVGMTGGQLKKMLMWEGVHYAVLTAVCSLVIGMLLNNVVVKSLAEEWFFFTYRFTLLPIAVCVPVLFIISAVIPCLSYRAACRESIIDRLREN